MKKSQRTLMFALVGFVAVGLIASVIALSVRIGKVETTRTIGSSEYKIGVLDDTSGKEPEEQENVGIFMKDYVLVDGLKCELAEDAKVEYSINFYDEDYKFISVVDYEGDFDGSEIPDGAKYARIEIRPTADKDGKVTLLEKTDYAKMLTVTVSK